MTGISEKEQNASNYDFALGVAGFHYSDLFDAPRLAELAENFYGELDEKEPILGDALRKYIAAHGNGYEKRVESKILTDAAPHLSEFVARLFHISRERDELQKEITKQNPIWAYKFFVQRRAVKKFSAEQAAALNETELTRAVSELKFEAFDETLIFDEELATATVAAKLLEAEEILTKNQEMTVSAQDTINKIRDTYDKLKDKTFGAVFARFAAELDGTGELLQIKAALQMLEAWSAIQFHGKKKKWHSFKVPHALDYQNLVHLIRPEPKLHNIMRGEDAGMRRRAGFKLTDDRGTVRDALYEVDYCLICHEREKDSCSTGLREKDGAPKRNPLGIKTEGCPLDEKISEMH
jgi:hypothetical protein